MTEKKRKIISNWSRRDFFFMIFWFKTKKGKKNQISTSFSIRLRFYRNDGSLYRLKVLFVSHWMELNVFFFIPFVVFSFLLSAKSIESIGLMRKIQNIQTHESEKKEIWTVQNEIEIEIGIRFNHGSVHFPTDWMQILQIR